MTYQSMQADQPIAQPAQPVGDLAEAGETRLRRRLHERGPGFWWTLAIIVLVLAIAYSGWMARELLFVRHHALAPGEPFTDRTGVTFTVLSREELTEVDAFSLSGENIALDGAVFLRYTVAVDNYVYIEDNDYSTVCSFDLVRNDGQSWLSTPLYDEARQSICRSDADEITRSQLVYPIFMVPTAMVDSVAGLLLNTPPAGSAPILSEPKT